MARDFHLSLTKTDYRRIESNLETQDQDIFSFHVGWIAIILGSWPSMAIHGHPWPPMAIHGHPWPPGNVIDVQCPPRHEWDLQRHAQLCGMLYWCGELTVVRSRWGWWWKTKTDQLNTFKIQNYQAPNVLVRSKFVEFT